MANIVATNQRELTRMQDLFERCKKNGLNPSILDQKQLKSIEPNVTGLAAIKVTETGIIIISIANKMAKEFISNGGEIKLNSEITKIKEEKIMLKFKEMKIRLKLNF